MEPGDRLTRSVSNAYGSRGLAAGDRLYVVNVKHRRARLLGSFVVGEILSKSEAERRRGVGQDGAFIALAEAGTASTFDFRPLPSKVLKSLRFVSKDRPRVTFDVSGDLNEQTFRSMRELTEESAARLDRFLETASVAGAERRRPMDVPLEEPDDPLVSLGVPSRAEYRAALVHLESHLGPTQVRMLRAHYLAPDQTATMRELSETALLEESRGANGVYGGLGKLLAKVTQRDLGADVRAGRANWAHMIARGLGRIGRRGEYALRLRPELSAALEDVGLVDATERSGVRQPVSGSVGRSVREDEVEFDVGPTERLQMQLARRGQGRFRASVVSYWGACAVTGCRQTGLLIASHIVPWSLCKDDLQRLDGGNGLLLTPNLDKLFDRGLITFRDDGTLMVSSRLRDHTRAALGLSGAERIVGLTERHRENLAIHRRRVFERARSDSDT